MTTYDHDTDPSTPGAKRPADQTPATGAAPGGDPATRSEEAVPRFTSSRPPPGPGQHRNSSRGRPTTDPGVAPPPPLLPVPMEPMGIVVPSAPVDDTNEKGPPPDADDSVDVLLDGMAREQPEQPRASPRRESVPVGSMATEPALRTHSTLPYHEPKVIIDRHALGQSVPRGPAAGSAPRVDPSAWKASTDSGGQSLAPRVAVAILAGLMVVALIFVGLQRLSRHPSAAASAPEEVRASTSTVAPAEPAPSTAVPDVVDAGSSEPGASASGPSARKPVPAPKASAKQRPRPPVASKPPAVDLGEFKGAL